MTKTGKYHPSQNAQASQPQMELSSCQGKPKQLLTEISHMGTDTKRVRTESCKNCNDNSTKVGRTLSRDGGNKGALRMLRT